MGVKQAKHDELEILQPREKEIHVKEIHVKEIHVKEIHVKEIHVNKNILLLIIGGDSTYRSFRVGMRQCPMYENLKGRSFRASNDVENIILRAPAKSIVAVVDEDPGADIVTHVRDGVDLKPSEIVKLVGILKEKNYFAFDASHLANQRDLEIAFE